VIQANDRESDSLPPHVILIRMFFEVRSLLKLEVEKYSEKKLIDTRLTNNIQQVTV